jgi:hypothetical protein
MLNNEALEDYREEAIAERAGEILTQNCTILNGTYMEAVENLQEKDNAMILSSYLRCIRKAPLRVEREMHQQLLGEFIAKQIELYMMPEALTLARRELEE